MNLRPLHDRVIIKPAPAEETTKGGLIIPDTVKEKPQRGEIIAIGEGKVSEDGKVHPLAVKIGDNVLYGKYAGTEISVDGTDYLIMRESDIFAIYNG
jgi:chaperonin GroES